MREIWALIDCNNFFVSCERVFRPDLEHLPVLVLSSNDGCVVSRSSEVKKLGIQMGAPRFQIENLIKEHRVTCFSSNFGLYADMSTRVMRTIREMVGAENQEIYSIDECFVRGTGLRVKNWQIWGRNLKKKLEKETGVPVTVGIAGSKTLAKLAVEVAKKDSLGEGAAYWDPEVREWQEVCADKIMISEVWGIGAQTVRKLFRQRVETVGQFKSKSQQWVRDNFGLGGERTWRELRGESCIDYQEARVSNKSILRSRSFGEGVREKGELRQAVMEFMTIAGENLRRNRWRASIVTVFVRTGYYNERAHKYGGSEAVSLTQSTSYLPDLLAAAMSALEKIYKKGFVYKKAGVILSGLESEEAWQPALAMGDELTSSQTSLLTEEKKQVLMKTVDKLNRKYGERKVNVGLLDGKRAKWRAKATSRSPEYTTVWEELRKVS